MMQPPTERELPMLAGIGAFVTWCEDLLAILSGPILTFGLGIALVALLTDGQLLVRVPALLWVWAISQAVGLDAQFIGASAKLARAIRRRVTWPILGYILLCGALGYVGFLASDVFATQEANGLTTAEALARLGMDTTSWIVQRSLLAVVLVFLSGFLRYVAPAPNVTLDAAAERAKLEAEIELEPLRQQLRAQQLRGARGAVAAAFGREQHTHPVPVVTQADDPIETPPDDDSTPPPSPGGLPPSYDPADEPPAQVASATALTSYTPAEGEAGSNGHRAHRATRSRVAKRARVRIVGEGMAARRERQRRTAYGILDREPDINPTALSKRIHSTWKTAHRLKADWHSLRASRQAKRGSLAAEG